MKESRLSLFCDVRLKCGGVINTVRTDSVVTNNDRNTLQQTLQLHLIPSYLLGPN